MNGFAKQAFTAVSLSLGLCAFGEVQVWWVDCNGRSDSPNGSESAPYRSIQSAVDAATAGDTVKVRPGVYDTGEIAGPGGTLARVVIDKAITLESTDGKDRTFVIGQKGNGSDGTGAGAVRCVVICNGVHQRSVRPVAVLAVHCQASFLLECPQQLTHLECH